MTSETDCKTLNSQEKARGPGRSPYFPIRRHKVELITPPGTTTLSLGSKRKHKGRSLFQIGLNQTAVANTMLDETLMGHMQDAEKLCDIPASSRHPPPSVPYIPLPRRSLPSSTGILTDKSQILSREYLRLKDEPRSLIAETPGLSVQSLDTHR